MSIPNKQIGWSQESNLLWEILSKLQRLTKVLSTSGGGSSSYKVYTALLSQTDSNPPTVIVLENTLGFDIVWSMVQPGEFEGTASQPFDKNKTLILSLGNAGCNGTAYIVTSDINDFDSQICLYTLDTGGQYISPAGSPIPIEIRVYN